MLIVIIVIVITIYVFTRLGGVRVGVGILADGEINTVYN